MLRDVLNNSRLVNTMIDIVDAIILVMDNDGNIVLCNKACQKVTGYSWEEVENKKPWDLFVPAEEVEAVRKVFTNLADGNFPNSHTNYWLTRTNQRRLIQWSNSSITNSDGTVQYVISTGIDITERNLAEQQIERDHANLEELVKKRTNQLRIANEQLAKVAQCDGLTGIFNRHYFNITLDKEIRRAVRTDQPLSLILCDIDYFKKYNDTFGHVAGDNCLKQIAMVISNTFNRAADIVARYGGEEFTVILPSVDSSDALVMADCLLSAIREHNLPNSASPIGTRVTMSIGVATMQSNEMFSAENIIESADQALYQAKKKGRDQVMQCRLESCVYS